jgi:hypothetical protein
MQFDSRSILASVSQTGGKSRISFQLPEKPFRERDAHFRQMMTVGIRQSLGYRPDSDQTLMTPFIPEMNEFYRNEMIVLDELRVQQNGFGVIVHSDISDLAFSALQTTRVIEKLFGTFGIHAEPSVAGRIASRLIHQMGGLQGCRVFKLPGVRQLIEQHSPLQSFYARPSHSDDRSA